ncbi:MAG: hypothetical protein ABJB76_12285 [Candidatus Nitrosocosmicus sp.]
MLINDGKNILHQILEDKESRYIAKTILLKDDGHTVQQIRKMIDHHNNNIKKCVHHRFNEKGIDCIYQKSTIINSSTSLMLKLRKR